MKRKKIVSVSFALVFLTGLYSYSQSSDSHTKKHSFGVLGGINIANMNFPNSQGPDDQEITPLLRFGVGAILNVYLSEHFNARFEPMYLQKGCNIDEGTDAVNQPGGQLKVSSIELPILIQYSFGKTLKPYLIAGPTFGYNLESEIEFNITGLEFNGDMEEITAAFDLGIAFGGGIQVPVRIGEIFLEVKYSYGLINQRESGSVTLESGILQMVMETDKANDKYTNRGIQIMAGITFPL